jgi:ribosomal protein S18 acetylase RimI-like enzyme
MSVDATALLPDGLVVRPWRRDAQAVADPRDVQLLLDLVLAAERAAIGETDSTRDDIEEMFASPTTDHDACVVVQDGGDPVAFAWMEYDPTTAESWIDACVLPDRGELLDGLLTYAIAVAKDHRTRVPDAAAWSLRSGSFASDAPLAAALERAGFERVRRFWRMRIDLTTSDIAARPLPSGVEILDARADPLRRTAYDVQTTAFHDHWNHTTRPYDEWFSFFDKPYLDPGGWWLVTVDDVPAAVCILDDSRRDIDEGYVRSLGVLREFRGRGLGRLLLERAFAYYRGRGMVGVQLGVDSESPTGANHLYESVGMTPHRVIDAWSRPID